MEKEGARMVWAARKGLIDGRSHYEAIAKQLRPFTLKEICLTTGLDEDAASYMLGVMVKNGELGTYILELDALTHKGSPHRVRVWYWRSVTKGKKKRRKS
jgi:hypothetical protein